jgi:hypothetical protein
MRVVPPLRTRTTMAIEGALKRVWRRGQRRGDITRIARRYGVRKQRVVNIAERLRAEEEINLAWARVRAWRIGHRLTRDDIVALREVRPKNRRRELP